MPWSNSFLNSLARYGNGGVARGITDFPDYLNSGLPTNSSLTGGYQFNQGVLRNTLGGKENSNWWDNILGEHGWGNLALGAFGNLGQALMGMKQYGLAKQALKHNREQFERNYAAQRQTINTALEDRQRARVASNPGAYEPVESYMARNRVR